MEFNNQNSAHNYTWQKSELNPFYLGSSVNAAGDGTTVLGVDQKLFENVNLQAFDLSMKKLAKIDTPEFIKPVVWGADGTVVYSGRGVSIGDDQSACIYGQTAPLNQKIAGSISLAKALESVHQANCLQREFFPENLIATENGWQLAFPSPLAFANPDQLPKEAALWFAQTASPELTGALAADLEPASDLYSLGVVFFKIFTGDYPFPGADVNSQLIEHLTKEPRWELLQQAPPILVKIIRHLLHKEPVRRYHSARALIEDLIVLADSIEKQEFDLEFVAGRSDVRRAINDPVFVGRDEELATMAEFLTRVDNDSTNANLESHTNKMVVAAQSGMGKSRFISEALWMNSCSDQRVFQAGANDRAGEHPLEVIRIIAYQAISYPDIVDRLKNKLSIYHNEIRQLLPKLATTLEFEPLRKNDLESKLNTSQTGAAIACFLKCLGSEQHPAIVWIDDCQWLEHQVCQVFSQADVSTPSVKFVFSTRVVKRERLCISEQIGHCTRLIVGPLNDQEIGRLVESMAGKLPDEATSSIVQLSAGSPFMAAAVLRGMEESGALHFQDMRWEIDQKQWTTVSACSSSANILANRIAELQDPVRGILQLAATHGREFNLELLIACSDTQLNLEDLELQLQGARDHKLIWQLPNANYAFVHDKIREAFIDQLPANEKSKIHLAIANYLQNQGKNEIFKIAFHFDQAGHPEMGLEHALYAARDSKSKCSLKSAKDFYEMAARGGKKLNKSAQFEIAMEIAEICMLLGEYKSAEQALIRASALAQKSDHRARVNAKLGDLEFKVGDKMRSVDYFEQALRSLDVTLPRNRFECVFSLTKEITVQFFHTVMPRWILHRKDRAPTEDEKFIWRLHSRLAHGYWYTKDQQKTLWAHLVAMNRSELFKPTPELANSYSEHAPAMSLIPWKSRGQKYVLRSVELREEFADLWGQGQSHGFHAILMFAVSEYETCIEKALLAESILQKTGDQWEINIARYQRAASHYRLGQFAEAIKICRETYDAATEIGDFQSTVNIVDVWVRAVRGEFPADILEIEKCRDIQDSQARCQLLLATGIDSFFRDRFSEAIDHFESGIQIAESDGVINAYTAPLYAWHATAKRMSWQKVPGKSKHAIRTQTKSILQSAKKARRLAWRFKNDLPHALRELAFASALRGSKRAARRNIEASIRVARQQNARFELAESLRAYATLNDEFGWSDSSVAKEEADKIAVEFGTLRNPEQREATLSLVDRFESLIAAGRSIFLAYEMSEIEERMLEHSKMLLRAKCVFLVKYEQASDSWKCEDRRESVDFDPHLVQQVCKQKKTMVVNSQQHAFHLGDQNVKGSRLYCPIVTGEKVDHVLLATNNLVEDCFSSDEIRIAEFIAGAAGSAFEKATGMVELDNLNQNLELKVAERTRRLENQTRVLKSAQVSLETARNEAECANQSKSDFLARMSHEIRTPISAVIGFADLILRGIVCSPDEVRTRIETIHTSGKHLLRLVNDLLDLSKVEADKLECESIHCNPVRLCFDAQQSLISKAQEKGIQFELNFLSSIPSSIHSDPTRLTQVLVNLIGNAIKFTESGSVKLDVEFISDEHENLLNFTISDTGVGMTDEQMKKIFDPFVQADTSTTRKFGGTGLGLSITKRIVEILGGSIDLASKLNQGSQFVCRLPLDSDRLGPMIEPDQVDEFLRETLQEKEIRLDMTGVNVLIVDDSKTNRDLLTYLLHDAQAQTSTAENGQQAVDAVLADKYDVVLMDMQMPVLGGLDATRMLREKGIEIPIVALTANSMKGDETTCIEAGCSAYLSKPIDVNELFATLGAMLCKQTEVSEPIRSIQVEPGQQPTTPVSEKRAETVTATGPAAVPDYMQDFALQFANKLADQFAEVRSLLADRATEEFGNKIHWIKGTAGSVGLMGITDIAAQVESRVECCDWNATEELLDSIEENLTAFLAEEAGC